MVGGVVEASSDCVGVELSVEHVGCKTRTNSQEKARQKARDVVTPVS